MRRRRRASPMLLFWYLVHEGEFCLCFIFVRGTAYISILFILQPNNYDEEEVAIITYSSILLSCQWGRIFFCVLAVAQTILVFFYCNPTTMMRRRWRASPMLVFCYLVDEGAFFWLRHIFGHGAANISIFLLQPNNYDEKEVAYVSILLSCW